METAIQDLTFPGDCLRKGKNLKPKKSSLELSTFLEGWSSGSFPELQDSPSSGFRSEGVGLRFRVGSLEFRV